jgi:hypothetical protein
MIPKTCSGSSLEKLCHKPAQPTIFGDYFVTKIRKKSNNKLFINSIFLGSTKQSKNWCKD